MRGFVLFLAFFAVGVLPTMPARAQTEMPRDELMNIARQFVAKIGKKFEQADIAMGRTPQKRQTTLLPEGEQLFFTLMLAQDTPIEGIVTAQVRGGTVLVSLGDFATALELPITVDGASGKAEGWYITEDKTFTLDAASRSVQTASGNFSLSERVLLADSDIFVPLSELASWFSFSLTPHVESLQIDVASKDLLPIQARLARAGKNLYSKPHPYPVLPLQEEQPADIAFPFVDVSTSSGVFKDGETGDTTSNANASVTTHGDIAGGVLVTQSQLNKDEKLTSLRATYRKDSPQADLLGPLKAHTYELGDLTPPRLPLTRNTNMGSGVRVTNVDPAHVYLNPSTGINGVTTPGWDVELYRGALLLDRLTVGPDGIYNFNDVDLFRSRNDFRLVFYGPQGQRREEQVSLPVDPSRLADVGSVYDIALTADGTQLYRKDDGPENEGSPRLTAVYEHSLGASTAGQLGLNVGARGESGDTIATTSAGVSTVMGPALLNLNGAVQSDGEMGGEFAVSADIGRHQLRNDLTVTSKKFDVNSDSVERAVLENELSAYGPSPIQIGRVTQYNARLSQALLADDVTRNKADLGLTWAWGRVSLNQNLRYTHQSDTPDDTLESISVARGGIGQTRISLDVDYNVKPETALDEVILQFQRSVSEDLDLELDLTHQALDQVSEAALQANWRSGHAIISPRVSSNTDGDMAATLNTTFGLARDPLTKSFRLSDEQAGTNGSVAVLVYLDKNGNNVMDEDDEPIENASIQMMQNGGSATTDKSGYAFFNRLQNFRQTDVVLVPDSLKDPYWLPAGPGVSILPREGHLTQLNYPVHMGGEIEGVIYGGSEGSAENVTLRGVSLGLYNLAGKKVKTVTSENDGYYLFSPVPPGEYMLVVDNSKKRSDRWMRPDPVPVSIGYEGTQIFAKNIYLTQGVDVPVKVMDALAQVETDDPGLKADTLEDKTVVLNLGSYHSRVLMGVMWFKIRKMAGEAVAGLDPLVAPADSFAAVKTGEHTLRVSAASLTLDDAAKRCREITEAGVACTVEVLPGGLRMAASDTQPKTVTK